MKLYKDIIKLYKDIMRCSKPTRYRYLAAGLVVYLLVFSSFALFHAYHDNELIDAQGCEIGLWLQHGQVSLFSKPALPVFVLLLFYVVPLLQHFLLPAGPRQISSRSPPAFSTL